MVSVSSVTGAPTLSSGLMFLSLARSSNFLLIGRRSLRLPSVFWKSRVLSHGGRMPAVNGNTSFTIKKKASEISNELKGTSIFLVGLNCGIKTKTGQILADALRYYYFDSDDLVNQAIGAKPANSSGRDEVGFQESETEVLKQLSSMGRLIVCAGDGTVRNSVNLAYIRHGISIWIDVPLDLVANEAVSLISTSHSSFKMLDGLTKRYEEMRGGYATSDVMISMQNVASKLEYNDIDEATPEDMAVEALHEIERLTRLKKMMEGAARPF